MENKIYLIKSLAPWMMDELLAFSTTTKFSVIFLRNQQEFYSNELKQLKKNGIRIFVKPYSSDLLIKKILFVLPFIIKNFSKFFGGYNTAVSVKSVFWFLRLDLNYFEGNTKIHSQFATQASLLAYMIKCYSKSNIEYAFTFHAHDIYYDNKWLKEMIDSSTTACSISEFNIGYLKNKITSMNTEKIKLSRLGVYKPENLSNNFNGKKLKIGLISWFIEKKGINYLLDALKQLKDKNVKLTLAGDGPLREEILTYVMNNNLSEHFTYLGKIKGTQKIEFFSSLDAFVLPAITIPNDMDGIPVVLMEAISYGLPIISTNVSGIPEICINDYNGYLIEQKNVQELVLAIRNMIDIENRMKFSKNSLKLSNDYDIISNSIQKTKIIGWK